LASVSKLIAVEDKSFTAKASQINEGFRIANGEVVITTDVDVETDEGAIQALLDSLSIDGVGAVCARQVLTNPDQNMVTKTEATYRGFYETLRIGEANLHSTPIFHGGLSGFRKAAVSPIAEDINADDTQLALSVIRNGLRSIYDPHSVFYAESPLNLFDGMRQRIRRAQGLQRVFWRNRDMLSRQTFGAFGFPIFAAEFYFHLVSPLFFSAVAMSSIALTFSVALSLTKASVFLALSAMLILALLLHWARSSRPVVLVTSFVLYQVALVLAAVLHLLGYNYKRWSKRV